MRWRGALVLVVLVVTSVASSAWAATAVNTLSATIVENHRRLDPYYLEMTYRSAGNLANNLVYTDVATLTEGNAYTFTDPGRDITVEPTYCRAVAKGVGTCTEPAEHNGFTYFDFPVVHASLGDGNDTFTTRLSDPLGMPHEFFVETGYGNDKIVLIDLSAAAHNEPDPSQGFDRVDCGPGIDRAIVSASVTRIANCENVTILPER